jgi:hypothetical protein
MQLRWLRERQHDALLDAGLVESATVETLLRTLEEYRLEAGEDAYLTGSARTNLARAYRLRGAGPDLADAADLAAQEVRFRTAALGPEHPATLGARSLHVGCLLVQAETADDAASRERLARVALNEVNEVRVVRDQMFGITSRSATISRLHEARALLLLGELDGARRCLDSVLAFETAHNDFRAWRGSGETCLLLARVHLALRHRNQAKKFADRAASLTSRYMPGAPLDREASALVRELGKGSRRMSQAQAPDRG